MKLTNRTVLIIGSELLLSLSLIKHLAKMNNKIIMLSHLASVCNTIHALYPQVITLNLNIYDEGDRGGLIEELSRRYLIPSCIIYNEFSFAQNTERKYDEMQFQDLIQSFFTSLTSIDESLFPLLETEADATIAYILPNLSLFHIKHTKLLYVLRRTILDYIMLMRDIHTHIRFIAINYPIKLSLSKYSRLSLDLQSTKLDKRALNIIHKLENYSYIF